MFADSDFILALMKESGWLKERTKKILHENKGEINTSISVMLEVAIVCKRLGMSVKEVFANIFEIIILDNESSAICLRAALYIEKYGLNVFDAFHAAYCFGDAIISSDDIYDRIGLKRITL